MSDPYSPMERRLLDTVRCMQAVEREQLTRIRALEQAVAAQADQISEQGAVMEQLTAILGQAFSVKPSNR